MSDTAVAEPNMSRYGRHDMTQLDLTHAVVELEALIDTILRSGYLDDVSGSCPKAERALLILDVCQAKAERAVELSRLCEEIQARSGNGL